MDGFNNGLRSHDVYMYILIYYGYAILLICFTTIFGMHFLGGYGIYVILHVVYGRIYVETAYTTRMLWFSEDFNENHVLIFTNDLFNVRIINSPHKM